MLSVVRPKAAAAVSEISPTDQNFDTASRETPDSALTQKLSQNTNTIPALNPLI